MNLTIRTKLITAFGMICLVIAISGIVSIKQVSSLLRTSVYVVEEKAPLVDAIMELKYWTAHAHLFLEEILSGDTAEDIELVWQELDQALWYCNAIIQGGKNSEGIYIASNDPLITAKLIETKSLLTEFIKMGRERYSFYISTSAAGSAVDQRFDDLYNTIMIGINSIATKQPEIAAALNYLKFEIADAHLFLEEFLSGDKSVDPELLKQQFGKALDELERIMLASNIEAANLQYSLNALLVEVNQRIQVNEDSTGAGSAVDQRFDRLFEQVISSSSDAETAILESMKKGEIEVRETASNSQNFILASSFITLLFSLVIGFILANNISVPVRKLTKLLQKAAKGNLEDDVEIDRDDEIGTMAKSFQLMIENQRETVSFANEVGAGKYSAIIQPRSDKDRLSYALSNMTTKLSEMKAENDLQIWLSQGLSNLLKKIHGEIKVADLAEIVCEYLAEKLSGQIASFYSLEDNGDLIIQADYAFHLRKGLSDKLQLGQGLVGQAARSGKLISITDIPEDYIRINSSLGDSLPKNIVVCPFLHDGKVTGVIELASYQEFNAEHLLFLENCMGSIGIAVNSAKVRVRVNELLEETQRNNEELQSQQEELQVANEELEEKSKSLSESEAELQAQQEELRVTNEELEERNELMLEKQREVEQKNTDLEDIKIHLELKAKELETSSKYKSEFLANMSHELRTPLNSLLILSQDLQANKEKNLTDTQVESAQVIHKGGNDLLQLINEILDLSKVESGQMIVNADSVPFVDINDNLTRQFAHLAKNKGLEFQTHLDPDLPAAMVTDFQRLEQILRNLCSNGIKFTKEGKVSVEIKRASSEFSTLVAGGEPIQFAVSDEGIGIPEHKHQEIFEAFQQVDGSTSREYGGTGLGLSISKELASLLGGVIKLSSLPGKGSIFNLYLPLNFNEKIFQQQEIAVANIMETSSTESKAVPVTVDEEGSSLIPGIEDDRELLGDDDHVILVVEDDHTFAAVLKEFCRERHYKFLHAGDGLSGLVLAERYRPDGIILDIKMPGMSGWDVLSTLKKNAKTKHIPVHIMTGMETPDNFDNKGAIGLLKKPVSRENLDATFEKIEQVVSKKIKDLLVVEDDETLRNAMVKLVGDDSVQVVAVDSGKAALQELTVKEYDCVILDLTLPDMSGFDVLEKMSEEDGTNPPVIIYTGKELNREEEYKLNKYASSIILKTAYSTERLFDEAALFLHKVAADLPHTRRKAEPKNEEQEFAGREILLVDDDMRNLFAISKILQDRGFKVHMAADGEKAIAVLNKEDNIELLLMDIMMPVMDGYEATKKIRSMKKYKKVPIIALTAKAMPADRQKCLDAGVSDYVSKPVDMYNLLSLVRVWI